MELLTRAVELVLPRLVARFPGPPEPSSPDLLRRLLDAPRRRRVPPLPLEIVLLILSSFSPPPSASLDARSAYDARLAFYSACSLVHSSWTAPARTYIKEKLRTRASFPAQVARLREVETGAARALRTLVVDAGGEKILPLTVQRGLPVLFDSCVGLESLSLVGVESVQLRDLVKLKNLRRLHLSSTHLAVPHLADNPLSLSSLTYLSLHSFAFRANPDTSVLRFPPPVSLLFPSVVALELFSIEIPLGFNGRFPSLRYLSILDEPELPFLRALFPLDPPSDEEKPMHLSLLSLSPNLLFKQHDQSTPILSGLTVSHLRLEPLAASAPFFPVPGQDESENLHDPTDQDGDDPYAPYVAALGLWFLLAGLVGHGSEDLIDPTYSSLRTLSMPALYASHPLYWEPAVNIAGVCGWHGIEWRCHGTKESAGRSKRVREARERANASEWKVNGFWEEVERMESERAQQESATKAWC
ncbi:hypothetical protein JCM8547_007106 [Rhodosporidiobolus lusitaniae]